MNTDTARNRIYAGNTVRLVNEVYKTETIGTIIFDEILSSYRIHDGHSGTWTITLPDGKRYRNEGKIYLYN